MDDEIEPKTVNQQPPRRDISRRMVMVGLAGLATTEAVAGGVSWQMVSQRLRKFFLALAPTAPAPTAMTLGTSLIYRQHVNGVNAVSWSLDGKRIASGSDDQTVQIWDATTGGHYFTYPGHSSAVSTVAWSSDGRRIASGGGNPSVQPVATPTTDPSPNPTAIPSPSPIADPSPTDTPTPVFESLSVNPEGLSFDITSGQANSDAQTILTWVGPIVLNWSISTTTLWLSASPPGGSLSSGRSTSIDVIVSAANLTPGTYSGRITITTNIGRQLAVDIALTVSAPPNDTTVRVWDATIGSTIFTYRNHKETVRSVVWSPNSTAIASGSLDRTVQIWDAATGTSFLTYAGHTGGVTSVAWSPDGKRIASASEDTTVRIWNVITGSDVSIYRHHVASVTSIAWSPEGTRIASGSRDTTVQVWRTV